MPVVSVIVVFHRVTPFLRPAVRSLLGQTLTDLELLLVDNGTGTGLAALEEDGQDPRIRVVPLPLNLGQPMAVNHALSMAQGEFVAMLDSDDIALPRRLEAQVAALRADASLGLVGCAADRIDSQGRLIGPHFTLGPARDHFAFTAYTAPMAIMMLTGRREFLLRHPFRPQLHYASDYDFVARACETAASCALPEVLGQYRLHSGQMTQESYAAQVMNACLIRLMTGRRRLGRAEDFGTLMDEYTDWLKRPPPLVDIYRHFARRCLADRQPRLAVYHARRMLAARISLPTVTVALGVLAAALHAAPRDAGFLIHLFLLGPLRAHGLRPLR